MLCTPIFLLMLPDFLDRLFGLLNSFNDFMELLNFNTLFVEYK